MDLIKPNFDCNYYKTDFGICINEDCTRVIDDYIVQNYAGQIQLVFTSPPFPLNRKKSYGNLVGQQYIDWLCNIGEKLKPLLTKDGSIVVEIGNAWNPGEPTISTFPLEALLELKRRCNLFLCQEFIYYIPAKLPGPTEWVNKKRIRVKDSFTRIWWLSTTSHPKASNANVLQEYSNQMQKLLKRGTYNSGRRPSEHKISDTSFAADNKGSILYTLIKQSSRKLQMSRLVSLKLLSPPTLTLLIPI